MIPTVTIASCDSDTNRIAVRPRRILEWSPLIQISKALARPAANVSPPTIMTGHWNRDTASTTLALASARPLAPTMKTAAATNPRRSNVRSREGSMRRVRRT